MSNNNSSECNTRFDDTYILYIGIDYHYNRNRNEQRHIKKEKCQKITVVNVILDFKTLTSYTSTIQVEIIITLETEMKRHT